MLASLPPEAWGPELAPFSARGPWRAGLGPERWCADSVGGGLGGAPAVWHVLAVVFVLTGQSRTRGLVQFQMKQGGLNSINFSHVLGINTALESPRYPSLAFRGLWYHLAGRRPWRAWRGQSRGALCGTHLPWQPAASSSLRAVWRGSGLAKPKSTWPRGLGTPEPLLWPGPRGVVWGAPPCDSKFCLFSFFLECTISSFELFLLLNGGFPLVGDLSGQCAWPLPCHSTWHTFGGDVLRGTGSMAAGPRAPRWLPVQVPSPPGAPPCPRDVETACPGGGMYLWVKTCHNRWPFWGLDSEPVSAPQW